jgi:hypothetical protein
MIDGLSAKENGRHQLEALNRGEYLGYRRICIQEGLTEFPNALFSLSDTLEELDLSNNKLANLPETFDQFRKLKVLFLSFNHFDVFPEVLGKLPQLDMVGFKGCAIKHISETALPINLRWLILSDNQLTALPNSFGQLLKLKKLALAGNQLRELPSSFIHCRALELVRLSANQLTSLPEGLFHLPKLAWLALAGNPVVGAHQAHPGCIALQKEEVQLAQQLGEGASGIIYQGYTLHQPSHPIAVKVFKGAKTSDGYPMDELQCCLSAGEHANLVKTFAHIAQADFLALLMELIPSGFANLGLPPNYQTCTRDTFKPSAQLSSQSIYQIALQMASVMAHLHQNQVSHGDVYAHNIMVNQLDEVMFGDFGAATPLNNLSDIDALCMEHIEVRAFGNLLDDLLSICNEVSDLQVFLADLVQSCWCDEVTARPRFTAIFQLLSDWPTITQK